MEHITERTLQALDTEIMKLIEAGDMTKETLACLDKLVDMKKDMLEISEMESMSMEQSYNSYAGGRGGNGRTYGGSRDSYGGYGGPQAYYPMDAGAYSGGSYAQRRDSMGRYSRNSEREQIRANIERQLDAAQSDAEREMIHRILSTI